LHGTEDHIVELFGPLVDLGLQIGFAFATEHLLEYPGANGFGERGQIHVGQNGDSEFFLRDENDNGAHAIEGTAFFEDLQAVVVKDAPAGRVIEARVLVDWREFGKPDLGGDYRIE